ncbi:hypothetical protein T458_00015 [Brevibacillus panacihumi W25]|uniref:Uncharacterized protein n=1 Tax=Brevibacillus panacihumi W25 TaxID=1408254 RepID=V6MEN6_9BACL|nr:hypothetical protein T458_00015 [Brevibacillus panacihumi W25]
MLNDLQRYKLANLLRNSYESDPWSLERIASHLGFQLTQREKEALRREINTICSRYSDLECVANIGKGYFLPRSPLEFQKIIYFYESRLHGVLERRKQFEKVIQNLKQNEPATV